MARGYPKMSTKKYEFVPAGKGETVRGTYLDETGKFPVHYKTDERLLERVETLEQQLVRQKSQQLAADILVAPHHGSRTSSSPAFVSKVNAARAIVSAGWKSRYGFPGT